MLHTKFEGVLLSLELASSQAFGRFPYALVLRACHLLTHGTIHLGEREGLLSLSLGDGVRRWGVAASIPNRAELRSLASPLVIDPLFLISLT